MDIVGFIAILVVAGASMAGGAQIALIVERHRRERERGSNNPDR